MRIHITSLFVDDQEQARAFYTQKLGFVVKHDIPMGEHRWLTLVSGAEPDGVELLLEPSSHMAVPPYREALYQDGIAAHSFEVADLQGEWDRLRGLGVRFASDPVDAGPVHIAVLNDTCGNLIQLLQKK